MPAYIDYSNPESRKDTYFENMKPERTGVHHAALTRDLPLLPVDDASHLGRHDPIRLPDVHLRRADPTVGPPSQERERHNSSSNNDDDREYRGLHKTIRVPDTQQAVRLNERRRQREDTRRTTRDIMGIKTESSSVSESGPRSELKRIPKSA